MCACVVLSAVVEIADSCCLLVDLLEGVGWVAEGARKEIKATQQCKRLLFIVGCSLKKANELLSVLEIIFLYIRFFLFLFFQGGDMLVRKPCVVLNAAWLYLAMTTSWNGSVQRLTA